MVGLELLEGISKQFVEFGSDKLVRFGDRRSCIERGDDARFLIVLGLALELFHNLPTPVS